MKMLNQLADRVLGVVAGSTPAGACVPTVGDRCYCDYNVPGNYPREIVQNCTGNCVWEGNYCF